MAAKRKESLSRIRAATFFIITAAVFAITLFVKSRPGRSYQEKLTLVATAIEILAMRTSSFGSALCCAVALLTGHSCAAKPLRFNRSPTFPFNKITVTQQTKGQCCSILAMGLLDDCALKLSGKTWEQLNEPLRKRWTQTEWFRQPITDGAVKAYNYVPRADLILTALGTALTVLAVRRSLRRFRTAQEVPLDYFRRKRRLKGYVVSVNDSDNVRFYHNSPISSVLFRRPTIKRTDLKYETMNVRLAGIDAPEMAHFGAECQPYAKEAKEWLTRFVEGRRVTIQLLRFDQYSRAVASVQVGWIIKKNVSVEMVKAGFATIYEDAGAEYGSFEPELRKHLKEAQSKRKGMWKQSWSSYISPSQYKKNLRENGTNPTPPAQSTAKWKPASWAFWK